MPNIQKASLLSTDRLNISQRHSLRGLKRCPHCGHYSGCRAVKCKNKQCRRQTSSASSSSVTDDTAAAAATAATTTVQLVSKCDIQLYSVKCTENSPPNHQSFVQITDKTISSDDESCIISRNAICYVKHCKEDALGVNLSCLHVRNALLGSCYNGTSVVIPMATAIPIDISIWFALLLSEDVKRRLWTEYCFWEYRIPMVQRTTLTVFVIKCDQSVDFPAGRLHLELSKSDDGQANYSCACQQRNSSGHFARHLFMLTDTKCDHLYLLMGALLSNVELKQEFKLHLDLMQDSFSDIQPVTEDFIKFSETIMSDCVEMTSASLSNPLESTSNPLDEFSSDSLPDETMHVPPPPPPPFDRIINDTSDDNKEENQAYILHTTLDNIPILDESLTDDLHTLQLIDCQIELMDQFKLTDHIDMTCTSHEFHLNDDPLSEQLDGQNVSDLTAFTTDLSAAAAAATTEPLQPIPNVYVEKSLVSADTSTSLKRKSNKRFKTNSKQIRLRNNYLDDVITANVPFDNWLGSVIERINMTMDFNGNGYPEKLLFSCSHGFFNNLRNRFASGTKRRLPSSTIVIEHDSRAAYAGLTQYTWSFSSLNSIRQIFSSRNVKLEPERSFAKLSNGSYKFIETDTTNADNIEPFVNDADGQCRKIQPTKFSTFLRLSAPSNAIEAATQMDMFIIDWIPNVLPRSQYGEMRLQFKFGHKKNNKLIDKLLI